MFNQLRLYYCFLHNICTTETESLFQNSSSFICRIFFQIAKKVFFNLLLSDKTAKQN